MLKDFKIDKIKKNFKSSYAEQNNEKSEKKITLKDYKCLKEQLLMKYDKRNFCEYLRDLFVTEHPILNLMFFKSLLNPWHIRLNHFFFKISLYAGFNALLYSEDFVQNIAYQSLLFGPDSIPFYSFDQIPRSVISYGISIVIGFISILIVFIPTEMENRLNTYLKTMDQEKITKG